MDICICDERVPGGCEKGQYCTLMGVCQSNPSDGKNRKYIFMTYVWNIKNVEFVQLHIFPFPTIF